MTEVLSKRREFDPMQDYSADNYSPVDQQNEFFRFALLEADRLESRTRMLSGPFGAEFTDLMRQTDHKVKLVNPDFGAEHIMPFSYQSQWVQHQMSQLSTAERSALQRVINWRNDQIELLHQEVTGPRLADQSIENGVLSIPPFASQTDELFGETTRGCTNACFRMVFGGVAGWVPSQAALTQQFIRRHRSVVTDDEEYFKLYQTDVFREVCDKTVVTMSMIGADFTAIKRIANKMKQKHPSADVYCTVNLASQTAGNAVWHASVVLGVQDGIVTYHDPVNKKSAFKTCTVDQFAKRWAFAYNRAVLTIAV